MSEQRDIYHMTNPSDLADVARQWNMISGRLADRLDQLEGRRGTPTFYSDVDVKGHRIIGLQEPTNDTEASTKKYADGAKLPVGFVIILTVDTDPADLLGYGTWEKTGEGKMIVGYSEGDSDFGTVGNTGGSKTKNLAHTHTINHTHSTSSNTGAGAATVKDAAYSGSSGSGGSSTQDVLNPYQVFYIWERTA